MTVDVLIVEDAEQDAALMVRELKKGGLDPKPQRVASAAALREALKKKKWDLVLADFELPSFDAFAALEIVRAVDPELPCIVVSGRVGEEVAVEAMRAGAQDFVPKDRLLRLAPVAHRELKDAEGRRAQARDARRVAAQHAMAVLLASGRPMRECMTDILRTLLTHLGWEAALLWEWNVEERVLRCTASWGVAPALIARSRALALRAGADLPGQVIESGRARWVVDYALDREAPRSLAARSDGLHTAVAIPVPIAGTICCVLEVFSDALHEEDPGTLGALDTLASQIGQAMGRDRALEALRESEARKAAVLDASLDAVVSIDHRGRVLEFNPAAERIFGYSEHEAVGNDLADLIIPSSLRDAHRRGLARYVATGEGPMIGRRVELPGMRKDGSEFPAEIVITRVGSTKEPTFTGFVRDMTQSVALFRALRAAEARQRVLADVGAALVQSLDHATALPRVAVLLADELCDWCTIHLFDDAGVLTQVAAAHRLPGKAALLEELWRSGSSSDRSFGPAQVAQGAIAHFVAHVTSAELAKLAGSEEQERILTELGLGSFIGVPLVARGAILGALSLAREPGRRAFGPEDLELATELARRCATAIDNALLYRESQESLRARDDFLALAAHELSTPLTPLRMRVQELSRLVSERCGDGEVIAHLEENVRTIDRSSKRLAELVDRLLDVSRVTVGRIELSRERFDLVALARELVGSLADELERAGSTIEWALPEKPVEVVWDRKRIRVALHNLLSNALKFGPGQPIELSIEERPGDEVLIAVRDHGPGLTREDRGRLFQRFARIAPVRQYGGFGLGLWIVRQIAEEHGGRVDVWSEPGEGALFGMTLPRE